MKKIDWSVVTKKHVLRAIKIFLDEQPKCPPSRTTFLVYKNQHLPAKHIRGMAYKIATNKEISKNNFSGGRETVLFFNKLGFSVSYQGQIAEAKKNKLIVSKTNFLSNPQNSKYPTKTKNVKSPKLPSKPRMDIDEKISISSKDTKSQKIALKLLLKQMFNGNIECEKTFPWLTIPSDISNEYIPLYNALCAYRGNRQFRTTGYHLKCDFVCETHKLIFEYDERQHFSEARRISLDCYSNIPTYYNRHLWKRACECIQAKDNNPPCRDETRAFYDSTRDIEAYKHGYVLIRIMHGQIDFEKPDAEIKLLQLIKQATNTVNLKIAMYLQTNQRKNPKSFKSISPLFETTDFDILVFPELCWVPFHKKLTSIDLANSDDREILLTECLRFSKKLGKAVVISSKDAKETIYSVFANAAASKFETSTSIHIKHTKTKHSAFELKHETELLQRMFSPILYKGYRIGLTICYDCTIALFSRMYGVQGIDLILNATGGNVVKDKWYKYNQSRAIENNCFTLVTMGGDGEKENSYVFGFNRNGKEIKPNLLNYSSKNTNIPGGLYLYDLAKDDNGEGLDQHYDQKPTENKNWDFKIPVGNVDSILNNSIKIRGFVHKCG